MKRTILIPFALLPLGCMQGGQSAPPPAAAATEAPASAPAATADSAAVPGSEGAAAAPSVNATAPQAEPTRAPAPAPKQGAAPPAPVAAAPAAAAPAPAPVATPKPRVRMVVPAGTQLPIEIETGLSTATSRDGDPVLAVLTEDVPLEGFKLDKGAEVRGRVLTAIPAKRVKGQAHLVVGFDAVMKDGEKIALVTESIDSMAESTSGKDKKIIAGSAVGGLILGAIKDGKKGAAIGTVVGAAAGTGAVLIMKGDEVELPRGAQLTIMVTK